MTQRVLLKYALMDFGALSVMTLDGALMKLKWFVDNSDIHPLVSAAPIAMQIKGTTRSIYH